MAPSLGIVVCLKPKVIWLLMIEVGSRICLYYMLLILNPYMLNLLRQLDPKVYE